VVSGHILKTLVAACVLCGILGGQLYAQEEPALPEGLGPASDTGDEPALPEGLGPATGESDEPGLPEGLESGKSTQGEDEPALPEGIGEEVDKPDEAETGSGDRGGLPEGLTGYFEVRGGLRTREDPYQRDGSIGETRLQLEYEKLMDKWGFKVTADFLYDDVISHHRIHLDEGRGWLDLREANFSWTPIDFADVKVGRQILTWGTGDLVFINDLFPKDWNSFFIGRDNEYLKAPSDAVKVSLFSDVANLDVVYTPAFNADRYIDGRQISYYNGVLGRRAGRDAIVSVDRPNEWFREDEIALRVYKNLSGLELAGYGYRGFWKSPAGMNVVTGRATFPDLSVYGFSARTTVGKGIGHVEVGYYDSTDDSSGNNPFVPNSEWRFLVGYEQEVVTDLTVGIQYYVELMEDYGAYRRTLPAGTPARDEDRHVVTLRLTKLMQKGNLRLSLFAYYSPSDDDAYLRPNVHYKLDDHWSAEVGANVFIGEDAHTFFGQFERDSNVYVAMRYGF